LWSYQSKKRRHAWNSIFEYFNRTHGRGKAGYKAGEKIAIKANLNNTTDHGTIERLNSSPHLILALVRQLIGPARVPQSSITVFDSSRWIPGNLYDKIHHEFPAVRFVDHIGGDGRVKAEFKPNAIPFSVETHNATGLDTTVVEAAYLIDAAVLRALRPPGSHQQNIAGHNGAVLRVEEDPRRSSRKAASTMP
jgi:hypothetical protein